MSDERSLFDSFERLVTARLKCMETLALSVMKRTTSLEARMAALEQPHTPVEATPVESERERNGRLLFKANASLLMYNCPVWETQIRQVQEEYCESAERYNKAADLVSLAQVEAVPDYTALKELLGHPGFSEDSFIDGYNRACRDVRRWIDEQEADHE